MIREIEGCQYKPEEWTKRLKDRSCDFPWNSFEYVRLATDKEIESHLRKICDEKYIGKKAKCLYDNDEQIITTKKHPTGYDNYRDRFWMCEKNEKGMLVYEQGIFAEIIPDKRKKPETKEERKKFMDELMSKLPDDTLALIYEFLDQYDI